MKITEHLDHIEKLVLDRAPPAEIRGHIQSIRDQLEAYEKEAQKMADREKEKAEIQARNAELEAEVDRWRNVGGPRLPGAEA